MERLIDLNQLNHSEDEIDKVIGISELEFREYMNQIEEEYDAESLLRKLKFLPEEIFEAIQKTKRTSEAIRLLWLARKKEKITVREFLETFFLLKQIRHSESFINWLIEKTFFDKAVEILKEYDPEFQVMMGTEKCKKWKQEEKSCIGCSSEASCKRIILIKRTLEVRERYEPKNFEDFLKRERWIQATINQIITAKDKDLSKIFVP